MNPELNNDKNNFVKKNIEKIEYAKLVESRSICLEKYEPRGYFGLSEKVVVDKK